MRRRWVEICEILHAYFVRPRRTCGEIHETYIPLLSPLIHLPPPAKSIAETVAPSSSSKCHPSMLCCWHPRGAVCVLMPTSSLSSTKALVVQSTVHDTIGHMVFVIGMTVSIFTCIQANLKRSRCNPENFYRFGGITHPNKQFSPLSFDYTTLVTQSTRKAQAGPQPGSRGVCQVPAGFN